MRAAGYSMATIGSCLLLGASVGGELLNPGAPELLTIFTANPQNPRATPQSQVADYLPRLVFTQLAISTIVFWAMSVWWERRARGDSSPAHLFGEEATEKAGAAFAPDRVVILRALVPVVPLLLLFAAGPPLELFEVPQNWIAPRPGEISSAAIAGFPAAVSLESKKHPAYNSRLIGLAMLVGVVIAMAVTPSRARDCVREFFQGAGYGFTHIVSLIVTANCFGKSIESAGLAEVLGRLIATAPDLLQPLAAFVPLTFAAISGSGMASTQSLYGFFHGPALALGIDPISVGALVSLGAAAGRTMSPVAAVVLMCATLTKTSPFTLAKRVAGPLLVGITIVVLLRLWGIL
jgi:DcuC family C4-dicarboxylate transporter